MLAAAGSNAHPRRNIPMALCMALTYDDECPRRLLSVEARGASCPLRELSPLQLMHNKQQL